MSASELEGVAAQSSPQCAEVAPLANIVAARVVERLRATIATPLRIGTATDRNLVTVNRFAVALDVAQSTVLDWLRPGLPSMKAKGLGRRMKRREAEALIENNGLSRSRAVRERTATTKAGAMVNTCARSSNVV